MGTGMGWGWMGRTHQLQEVTSPPQLASWSWAQGSGGQALEEALSLLAGAGCFPSPAAGPFSFQSHLGWSGTCCRRHQSGAEGTVPGRAQTDPADLLQAETRQLPESQTQEPSLPRAQLEGFATALLRLCLRWAEAALTQSSHWCFGAAGWCRDKGLLMVIGAGSSRAVHTAALHSICAATFWGSNILARLPQASGLPRAVSRLGACFGSRTEQTEVFLSYLHMKTWGLSRAGNNQELPSYLFYYLTNNFQLQVWYMPDSQCETT